MSGEFGKALAVLFESDDVVEIRALKDGTAASGYFSDHTACAEEAAKLEELGFTVYATINPVKDALLARAKNRVRQRPKSTTSDTDILRRQ